jgi:two-component system NarL family response regulator
MSANNMVRILIADDHPVVCEGVASLLARQAGFCVVAQASNGKEAVQLYRQHLPDVAVLDKRMPVMDGLEALQIIRKEFPQARILLLSNSDAQEDIYVAVRAGVRAYLLKDTPAAELLHAIAQVAGGEIYLPVHISGLLAERMRYSELTAREKEILRCVVGGMSNAEIGGKLFISEGTVKVHVANILTKMNVHDRTQAATAAIKRGLVEMP